MKKYLFIVFLFLFGLCITAPGSVHAQKAENIDNRCFTKSECIDARRKMGITEKDLAAGFYNNNAETAEACLHKKDGAEEELGFCLPAGQTSTTVRFGGTTRFANIGVFIQYMYRYGMIFASILAVLVIIVAGLQWTASGGNSSTIESAKHRITGALTGLILAASAYVILNAVNPSTVNLRLPQVWLIRENKLQNQYAYCMELPATVTGKTGFIVPKIAPYRDNYQAIKDEEYKPVFEIKSDGSPSQNLFPDKKELAIPNAKCGDKMVIQGTDGQSCISTFCPGSQVCYDDKPSCANLADTNGGIVGRIAWTGSGKYLDTIWLDVACEKDGVWEINQIDSMSLGEAKTFYYFNNVLPQADEACDGRANVKGFFFIIEVNDSSAGATFDDQWIGGKSFCRIPATNSCGVYGSNGRVDQSDATELLLVDGMEHIGELFSVENIADGQLCDFKITNESMPNLGNGVITSFVSGLSHILGGASGGDFVDNALDANAGNAIGSDFCPYLKDKSAKFEQYVKERLKKR